MRILIIFLFFFISNFTYGQTKSVFSENLYFLLDELANDHLIEYKSVIKPLNKLQIIDLLEKANQSNSITKRKKKEIKFYLEYFLDEESQFLKKYDFLNTRYIFNEKKNFFSLKPIWSYKYQSSVSNDLTNYALSGGLLVEGKISNIMYYASLIDNTSKYPSALPEYLNLENGGNYKTWLNNDYSNMTGGIYFTSENFEIGIYNESFTIGDNYNGSNIFSNKSPAFPYFKFTVQLNNWIEMDYIHASLNSEIVDSSNSYYSSSGYYKGVYKNKYLSANLFTTKLPFRTNFSFGNSIIYSDYNYPQFAFLFPHFFYKSVDHSKNNNTINQNSQIFFNLSSRYFKNIRLFSSVLIDEFSMSRLFRDDLTNFYSMKIGGNFTLLNDLFFISEYTMNSPFVYKHIEPATTFTSNTYNLGHFMRDNSQNIFFSIKYKPNYRAILSLSYNSSLKGEDLEYNFQSEYLPTEIQFLDIVNWRQKRFLISFDYKLNPKSTLSLDFEKVITKALNQSLIERYTSPLRADRNNFFTLGLFININ